MIVATTYTGHRGTLRVIATLANLWNDAGRRGLIASLGRRQEGFYPLARAVSERWLGVAERAESKWAAVTRNRSAIRAIRRLIAEQGARVVIGFGPRSIGLTYAAARRLPRATVGAVRGDPGRNDSGPLWRWLVRRIYSRITALVVQTAVARDHFPPSIAWRAREMPNAASDARLGTADPLNVGDRSERQVVARGQLVEEKGYEPDAEVLAEAMDGLMRNHAARERLGSEASSVRDRFAPERIFAMWDGIVAPLMSRASDSRIGR